MTAAWLVSIPAIGEKPVDMCDKMPDQVSKFLRDVSSLLVDPNIFGNRLEAMQSQTTYMDPKLQRSPKAYALYLEDFFNAGLIRFGQGAKARVSVFFVRKKNGKLRMVLDCRAVNHLFKECPGMPMGSGSTWQEIILDDSADLWISLSDIKDYFYEPLFPSSCLVILASPTRPPGS